jgi:hypothetical protein
VLADNEAAITKLFIYLFIYLFISAILGLQLRASDLLGRHSTVEPQ